MPCLFKKVVQWEDPNLSASFLTVGNLAVLFLYLVSENVGRWMLFTLVWGVFPVGLLARLGGFDNQLMSMNIEVQNFSLETFGLHRFEKLQVGVILLVAAKMISVIGLIAFIGIVGNGVMIAPLVIRSFPKSLVKDMIELMRSSVSSSIRVFQLLKSDVEAVHVVALPVVASVTTFLAVLLASSVVTSDKLLVSLFSLVGYGLLASSVFGGKDALVVDAKPIQEMAAIAAKKLVTSAQLKSRCEQIVSLVLWENYYESVIGFGAVYSIYVLTFWMSLPLVIALTAGVAVGVASTPDAVMEKLRAKLSAVLSRVKKCPYYNKVNSIVQGLKEKSTTSVRKDSDNIYEFKEPIVEPPTIDEKQQPELLSQE